MIVIMGEVIVDESAVEGVKDALNTMEQESRKEPGCITYAFSTDINDAACIRISEQWESMTALEKHFATPHMAAFGQAVATIKPKSIAIKAFEIAREVKLPGM